MSEPPADRNPQHPSDTIIYLVSALVFAIGLADIAFVRSAECGPGFLSEVGRDLGITLCSIGILSTVYEALIRKQLLADFMRALRALSGEIFKELLGQQETVLQAIVNPDASRLGVVAIFGDRSEKAERQRSLEDVLRSAKIDIVLFGLALYNVVFENRDLLCDKIYKTTCSIRILLFNADSPFAPAMDTSLGRTPNALLNVIRETTRAFADLQNEVRAAGVDAKRFEVRVFDVIPPCGMIVVDHQTDTARIFVELNGVNLDGQQCPGLELRDSNPGLYRFFARQVEDLWEHRSKPLTISPTV